MKYYNMPDSNKVTASERIIAALIDYAPVLILSLLFYIPFMVSVFSNSVENMDASSHNPLAVIDQQFSIMKDMIFYMSIILVIFYTYYLSKDLFGGRSLGKRHQKLQIVRKSKNIPVSPARLALRNLTIFIYFIELIMYFVDPNQRLGDKLCDTMVVHANEYNKQPVDKSKVALTIFIIFIALSVLAILYYFFMTFFFDQYLLLMNKMIEPRHF